MAARLRVVHFMLSSSSARQRSNGVASDVPMISANGTLLRVALSISRCELTAH
jgi:hypothetical protein